MDAVLPQRLREENTVEVSHVQHRLALGVEWLDAVSGLPVDGRWVSELQAIGARPLVQRTEGHPRGRHALRAAGRLAKLLKRADEDKLAVPPPSAEADPTNFVLRAWGEATPRAEGYATGNDPRRYVPRRLSFTPVQAAGVPTAQRDNIRAVRLWPGTAYPLAAHTSALRGRVRRGPSLPASHPVAWARIVVTRPNGGPPDFATETQLAWGHGDDRGEFLVVLGPEAVPGGAALPATLPLRVWVFLPPADSFDPQDPLASLPLEVSGTAATSALLDGKQVPATYVQRGPIDIAPPPGKVFTMNDSDLRFT